jgi:threonine dehydrogenase-like Zn-dependent dehydrogenase
MKALRVNNNRVAVEDISRPEAEGECLVSVALSGICNTDLEIVRGYAGFNGTIGHEFVGVVESCDSHPEMIGKRVVGEINAGCGKCDRCMAGDSRHCPTRTVLGIHGRDGAHAEYLSLPASNLVALPETVSDIEAVFAEPLAAAYGIGEQVAIGAATRVAVVGDGKLGLLCAMTAGLLTKELVLIGKHAEKMSIAENVGIETVPLANANSLAKSFDVVIEASGAESGFATALDLVKPRGKIVLKSTFQGTPTWDAARVVIDEISIVGSRCGRLAPAVELLASKKLNVEDLVSDEFNLAEGVAGLEHAGRPGVLKVLLRP